MCNNLNRGDIHREQFTDHEKQEETKREKELLFSCHIRCKTNNRKYREFLSRIQRYYTEIYTKITQLLFRNKHNRRCKEYKSTSG